MMSPIQLTDAQIEQFRQDGFLVFEKLIDAALVARLVDRIDPCLLASLRRASIPMNGTGDRV
ncbi:MAG: hypothetical protein EDM05_038090 [Leptolyngbya sp. IPPAS B-1204]